MIQVVFHGLGGQGAKSAADLLAEAAFEEGRDVQAFPEFGPERRGAPVKAFVRISDKKITTHEPVVKPDYTVIIEPSLVSKERMAGICMVNSMESVEQIKKRTGFDGELHVLDAAGISAFANLPMLGALVRIYGIAKIEIVMKKAEELFLEKLGREKTLQGLEALRKGYEMIK